jgi:arylsulfatase A-like enzyme
VAGNLEWIGTEVPLQVDGWPLQWARNPARRLAENRWGLPAAHCVLTVLRTEGVKYVQFAADPGLLPPLLFDLGDDPGELHDLARDPQRTDDCYRAARSLLQWRMREDDRELANSLLTRDHGLVNTRDSWR